MNSNVPLVPLLFVDLDSTVRKGYDELGRWVNDAGDVEVFPEAVRAIRAWKNGGGRVAAVTNQGGIALGHITWQQVYDTCCETDRQADDLFDFFSICPHHPDAPDSRWARCWCRKPKAGLLAQAAAILDDRYGAYHPASMALMVGDRPEDEQAAAAADVDFQWAADWRAEAPA